jgi:hypothetical protein
VSPTLKEGTSFNIVVTCAAELSGCDYSAEAEIRRAEGEGEMKEPKADRAQWLWLGMAALLATTIIACVVIFP